VPYQDHVAISVQLLTSFLKIHALVKSSLIFWGFGHIIKLTETENQANVDKQF
jgi:hypothetical protein